MLSEEEKKVIEDIKEILELAKDEIENNDENITATLDLQDLKSLKNLYDLYNAERALNQELQIRYKIENDKYKQEKEKVDKQQREIEELKKPKYIVNFENNEIKKITKIENDFISKDKIREKLEKYKVLAEKSKTEEELYIRKNQCYLLEYLLNE